MKEGGGWTQRCGAPHVAALHREVLVLRRTEGMGANTQDHCHGSEGKPKQKLRGSVMSLTPHESAGKQTMGGEMQSPGGPGGLLHGQGRK